MRRDNDMLPACIEPSPFPYWFLIAAWIGFGIFLGVSVYHMKDAAQCPTLVMATGAEYAGAGK